MTKAMMKVKGCLQIQEEVLQELKWDSRVDATKIGVTVHEGVVKLTGQVDNYAEKLAAQDAAHRVAGALDVANDLEVAAPGHVELTDTDIAQAVRRALEWDVWVQDERIQSTVADGWVTLDGSVDLLREADDAERAIRRLEGVRGVTHKIVVTGQKISEEDVRGMI